MGWLEFSSFPVIVSYLGQTSNGFVAQTTTTAPGIFTQNGAGTGPADVLNSNGTTVNGPNTPAAKGSTVSVYMTGEGATTPKGVDGAVTCSAGCSSTSQIPIPLLPVSVLVDGQPASLVFYGEAPGLVSGVMQVNFTIPAAAHSGTVSLVVSVGNNQSQQNVTLAVNELRTDRLRLTGLGLPADGCGLQAVRTRVYTFRAPAASKLL